MIRALAGRAWRHSGRCAGGEGEAVGSQRAPGPAAPSAQPAITCGRDRTAARREVRAPGRAGPTRQEGPSTSALSSRGHRCAARREGAAPPWRGRGSSYSDLGVDLVPAALGLNLERQNGFSLGRVAAALPGVVPWSGQSRGPNEIGGTRHRGAGSGGTPAKMPGVRGTTRGLS